MALTIEAPNQATVDRWLAAGTWVEFAPGERFVEFQDRPHGYTIEFDDQHGRPPADWEPQKCETCDGNGGFKVDSMILYGIPGGEDWGEMCTDCNGTGIRRHPVTVPCQFCRGNPMKWLDVANCPKCGPPRGRITVAWATVEWGPLPVETQPSDPTIRPFIIVRFGKRGGVWLVVDKPIHFQKLTIPPDIDPQSFVGQWARGGTIEVAS